jgi:hypothetical protein
MLIVGDIVTGRKSWMILILQVANEETVLAVGFFIIVAAVARSIGAPYTSWANGHIEVRPPSPFTLSTCTEP